MTHYLISARSLAAILALVVGLTLVAPPAFSAQPQGPVRPLATAATARVEALPAAAVTQAAQATPAPAANTPGDKPFFKSTKGIVVLVLMATGVGWAVASRSSDAVHSPGRN